MTENGGRTVPTEWRHSTKSRGMQEYGPANRLAPGLVILHLARPHLKYNLKIITRLIKDLFTTAAWTAN